MSQTIAPLAPFLDTDSSVLRTTPTLGDYRLVSRIGQGGIAEVYKAVQMSLEREVAVKVLSSKLSKDPDIVRRFDRESLVIARLSHPNIVQIINKGFSQGRYYFVMEYVQGASFKDIIAATNIDVHTKLEIVINCLKALDYAHKNGVIHRDIKPANILIDIDGNAKVADFGIAQIIGAPDEEKTSTDVVMGTLAYMSPEQKVSSTNVDHTTDIYAVGVMLYEILVGQKPLGKFKLPSELNPRWSTGWDRVIEKCLAQSQSDRYRSAVALKDELLELTSSQSGVGGEGRKDPTTGVLSGIQTILGKCQFLDTIRENSYSATYLVEQTDTKGLYVIKRHTKGQAGLREARTLTKLSHPHILRILGAGGDQRKTVVVSDYAPGGSLADRLVRKYDWRDAFAMLIKIAEGLAFAHKNGVMHGDLRPSNILFDIDDNPKISDFGLPPHYDGATKDWYVSPERTTSVRGDIYSLGVIAHQMIFGRMPMHDRSGALQIEDARAFTPTRVGEIIAKALEIRPNNRQENCPVFIADIKQAIAHADEIRPIVTAVEPPAPPAMWRARLKEWSMLAIGLGVGISIGLVIAYAVGVIR